MKLLIELRQITSEFWIVIDDEDMARAPSLSFWAAIAQRKQH